MTVTLKAGGKPGGQASRAQWGATRKVCGPGWSPAKVALALPVVMAML